MFKGGRPTFRGYAEHGSTFRSIDYLGKDMSETDWKIPAIKYHQLHGLDSRTPIPKRNAYPKDEIENIPILGWWKKRVENTYNTYRAYSDIRILLQCFLFCLPLPFFYFCFMDWIRWFNGLAFNISRLDPNEPIYAVIFAPIIETFIFFLIPLEIARLISLPRWFSYPLLFIFFESIHHQRSFFEHPIMWMTGYMFIVAYEAGRTRSLLHAIIFCILVHEAYNLSCYLLHPAIYPNPF